jgi:hypothetical protein
MTLLDQFLREEATPGVCQRLLHDISTLGQWGQSTVREYAFNRFNLHIESGFVRLQDDLDTSEAGEVVIGLPAFVAALRQAAV